MRTRPKERWSRLFLLFALLLVTMVAKTTLSAQAPALPPVPSPRVREIPPITWDDLKAQFPINAQGSLVMQIPEILNSSGDKEARAILSGKQVETVGEVIAKPDSDSATGRIRVSRAQIPCCAAHARACAIDVSFSGSKPEVSEGCWVKLAGLLTYEADGLVFRPLLTVTAMAVIPAPKDAILK
jgi:hypothetical protein